MNRGHSHHQFIHRGIGVVCLFLLLLLFAFGPVEAGEKSKRSKVIDFDDDVVEGLNKRPLDSLNQISEKGRKKKKLHLYHKRVSFRSETKQTLGELRYVP